MTGAAVKSARAGFNNQTGKPNVLIDFTADGSTQIPGDHPRAVQHRPAQTDAADVRHRARQRHVLGPDDRLHPGRPAQRHQRRRRDQRRQHDDRGGQEPRPRAQHRRPAGQARDRLPAGGLGHARQGLAQPGPHRRDHRPRHRAALHAAVLPLPRPGGRPRAHRVRDPPVGALQPDPRDAHAPGHRRHDPHHRCGRRRQRRHLRAHQGRGTPRQDGALRGQLRLRARLPHDPGRQRAHRPHRARALPVRDRRPQGLRVHAHHRRHRQHAHRRALHTCHARRARRVRVLQQAGVHGRQGGAGRHRDRRHGRLPLGRLAQARAAPPATPLRRLRRSPRRPAAPQRPPRAPLAAAAARPRPAASARSGDSR